MSATSEIQVEVSPPLAEEKEVDHIAESLDQIELEAENEKSLKNEENELPENMQSIQEDPLTVVVEENLERPEDEEMEKLELILDDLPELETLDFEENSSKLAAEKPLEETSPDSVQDFEQPSTSAQSSIRQKSLFTTVPPKASKFNPTAPPFIQRNRVKSSESIIRTVDRNNREIPFSHIGPTQLPVNSRIWNSIAAIRPTNQMQEGCGGEEEEELNYRTFSAPAMQESPQMQPSMDIGSQFGPVAMPNGTIQIRLRDGVRVDMTVDKSVRVMNSRAKIVISLCGSSGSAALSHPNGQVFQHGSLVDIVAFDGMKRNTFVRFAKMWQKGISLTSDGCALIYLVDAAGTRTTSDAISFDISRDYTIPVFLNGSRQGPACLDEAITVVHNSTFWLNEDGSETFEINSFRITQTVDGLIRLTRANNKCIIRTSPSNGSATLTTPFIHCTASLGQTSHLFVRRGERRMHFDGTSFVVRNAGHSAGFDELNRLRVY